MNCGQVMWWVEQCKKRLDITRNRLNYPMADEVSIAYASAKDRDEMLVAAQECGFNTMTVYDTVFYEFDGRRGSYGVEYSFLTQPAMEGWRIELVCAKSPFHQRLFYSDQVPKIVHVSFKCASATEWFAANQEADQQGFAERMRCASSYGQFSYRRPIRAESWPLERVYLKPRLSWDTMRRRASLP